MRISIIISQIELEMLTHAWRLRCSDHRSARISWKIFIYWNFCENNTYSQSLDCVREQG